MGKKIAIIGTTASMMDAPYDDPSWEIWGLNGAYTAAKRYDRWFDMHDLNILKKVHDPKYMDFLTQCGDKLMLNKKYDEFPKAKVFPYDELIENNRRYFSNTVAWLTAYAIEQNPDTIGIWGVNMATDSEYMHQRPCCEYYLGIAEGKGIEVIMPESSEILKYNRLYGIEPLNPIMVKLPDKEKEIKASLNTTMRRISSCESTVSNINGYMNGVRDTIDSVVKDVKDTKLKKTLHAFELEKSNATKEGATSINNEIMALDRQKLHLEGALNYNEYLKVNWS